MQNRAIILLGLLMSQSQHGYLINEFIEENLSFVTNMKKPTAYATLDRLHKQGYIEVTTEQEGNRPPRKVYSINDKGRQYFFKLLLENLSTAEQADYKGDIGIMFIDHLPPREAVIALKKRLSETEKLFEYIKQTPDHQEIGVSLVVEHKFIMLHAEKSFLEQTIEKLEKRLDN